MLHDQVELAISYLEAYQITKDVYFADVARDILDYVLRDMRGAEGGFYSAQDADSLIEQGRPEHAEGAFYVWSADQIREVLETSGRRFSTFIMASPLREMFQRSRAGMC